MRVSAIVSLCVCMTLSTHVGARDSRKLLQDPSALLLASAESQAAAYVQSNLTAPPPINVTAASSAISSVAISSTATYSSALASAFIGALYDANATSGNATAQALSSALVNVTSNSTATTVIAQAYASAILSFYNSNRVAVRRACQSVR